MMILPKGSRSVSALAMSPDDKYLCAADMSDNHEVHLFDLTQKDRKGNCLYLLKNKTNRVKIFQIMWTDATNFVSVGVEHIYFWKAPNMAS